MSIDDEARKIYEKACEDIAALMKGTKSNEEQQAQLSGLQRELKRAEAQATSLREQVTTQEGRLIDMAERNTAHVARIAELERQLVEAYRE